MPIAKLQPLNLIATFIVSILLCAFQTTFWYQIFGSLPAPQLWLTILVYILLYRTPWWNWIEVYVFALIYSAFTSNPIGILWMKFLAMSLLLSFVKNRIFWTGPRYFLLACIGTTFSYHLISLAVSNIFENNPVTVEPLYWLSNIIITPLFALPVYWILQFVDSVTRKDPTLEGGGMTS